jgi:plasmid stabilization system protein ParE
LARRIVWSKPAQDDLHQIKDFINVKESLAARKFIRRLANTPKSLPDFPDLGRLVPELEDLGNYREVIVGGYRIIYSYTQAQIDILRVLNSTRDFETWRQSGN